MLNCDVITFSLIAHNASNVDYGQHNKCRKFEFAVDHDQLKLGPLF